jgi:hypothetical protein
MKLRHLAPLACALLAGALPVPLAADAAGASAASHNWSGYAAAGADITAVSGAWTVPQASGAPGAGDAEWVGIGGLASSDLIQAGTRARIGPAGPSYEAWYELLPAPATPIALAVAPGDLVSASITQVAPDSWRIELADRTSGARFSTTLAYRSSESSAEWILEAAQAGGGAVPLDDFSPARWSAAAAEVGGGAKTPAALGATRVSLVGPSLAPLAIPSLVTGTGSFTIERADSPTNGR